MLEKEFEDFLHTEIPITKEMNFSVEEYTPMKVRIGAKLKPNINQQVIAFGGSVNSVMTICGWSLVLNNIYSVDPNAIVLIQKSSIEYFKKIESDFVAECKLINNEKREKFVKTYTRLGKARLEIHVTIKNDEETMASFRGLYVVLKNKE